MAMRRRARRRWPRRSATAFARSGAAGRGADPSERRSPPAAAARAAATSGWNSSATACSASSSPSCCGAAFPTKREGELTRRHTAARAPRDAGRGGRRRSASATTSSSRPARRRAGARANPGVLADACEAVIAALYLDGGLDGRARFVERWWDPRSPSSAAPPRDPKTALQEWAQARGLPLPAYRTVAHRRPGACAALHRRR